MIFFPPTLLCLLSFTAERNWDILLYIVLSIMYVCSISCFRVTVGLYSVRLTFFIAFLLHGCEQWCIISVEHN
jgi:hypothetical protein